MQHWWYLERAQKFKINDVMTTKRLWKRRKIAWWKWERSINWCKSCINDNDVILIVSQINTRNDEKNNELFDECESRNIEDINVVLKYKKRDEFKQNHVTKKDNQHESQRDSRRNNLRDVFLDSSRDRDDDVLINFLNDTKKDVENHNVNENNSMIECVNRLEKNVLNSRESNNDNDFKKISTFKIRWYSKNDTQRKKKLTINSYTRFESLYDILNIKINKRSISILWWWTKNDAKSEFFHTIVNYEN